MVNLQQGVEVVDLSIEHIGLRDHAMKQIVWFDPISSVELISSQQVDKGAVGSTSNKTQKRPRGRPKRNTSSLPDLSFVLSTPSQRQQEAVETWNCAKTLGVRSTNEKDIISQLRKSKRLMSLEDGNLMR